MVAKFEDVEAGYECVSCHCPVILQGKTKRVIYAIVGV